MANLLVLTSGRGEPSLWVEDHGRGRAVSSLEEACRVRGVQEATSGTATIEQPALLQPNLPGRVDAEELAEGELRQQQALRKKTNGI